MEPKLLTATMVSASFTWVDTTTLVNHCLHVLQTTGPAGVRVVQGIMKLVGFALTKDMIGVWVTLNAEVPDVESIIEAIRLEFAM